MVIRPVLVGYGSKEPSNANDSRYRLPAPKRHVQPARLEVPLHSEQAESASARRHCINRQASACFLLLLKTFQRLGCFAAVRDVPPDIVQHIAKRVRVRQDRLDLDGYDRSGAEAGQQVIREHLGVRRYDATAEIMVNRVIHETAQTRRTSPISLMS